MDKQGKAEVNYEKHINIVQSSEGKLLVVIIRNTGNKFLETPPTWEGLEKMGKVMNNLVQGSGGKSLQKSWKVRTQEYFLHGVFH